MKWKVNYFQLNFILLLHLANSEEFLSNGRLRSQYLIDLNEMLNDKSKYDKNYFPPAQDKQPIRINVSMVIYDLREVTEKTMSFRSDIYFTQVWSDERCAMNKSYENLTYSVLEPEMVNLLWHPDTYFENALDATSEQPGEESFTHRSILKITGRGVVYYRQRLSITANCRMNLQRYPFDFQLCKLSLRSFALTMDDLQYSWEETTPLVFVTDLSLPDFILTNSSTARFTRNVENDNFSALNACFMFERKTNFYFMELYIPASMVVIVAWLSSLTEYRFTNLLSVLLAQLFIYFSYITVMPKVSDVKALDVFLVICFLFIFVALVTTFFIKDQKPKDELKGTESEVQVLRPYSNKKPATPTLAKRKNFRSKCFQKVYAFFSWPSHHYCQGTNCILFTSFPALFAVFSLVYYIIYMYVIHDQSQMDRCNT